MAYNTALATRVRESLASSRKLEEKKMFGGVAFMVNGKMCVGIWKNDLMIRCEKDDNDHLLKKKGVRQFAMGGRAMKGWLLVGPETTKNSKDFDEWIEFALALNKKLVRAQKK